MTILETEATHKFSFNLIFDLVGIEVIVFYSKN